eukprot:g61053.t1
MPNTPPPRLLRKMSAHIFSHYEELEGSKQVYGHGHWRSRLLHVLHAHWFQLLLMALLGLDVLVLMVPPDTMPHPPHDTSPAHPMAPRRRVTKTRRRFPAPCVVLHSIKQTYKHTSH